MKIALTQSEGRLASLAEALTAQGHEVVRQPLIRTEPLVNQEVRGRAEELFACTWLLFTSPSAVEAWHALALPLHNIQPKIGVVGEKTAQAVRAFRGEVALIGKPQNAEGLAGTFLREVDLRAVEQRVGLPRGNRALKTLQEGLAAHNIQTFSVTIYKTVTCPWQIGEVDIILLASPSAAQALPEEVGRCAKLISLGPSTSAAITERGWRYVQAETPSTKGILKTFEREEVA